MRTVWVAAARIAALAALLAVQPAAARPSATHQADISAIERELLAPAPAGGARRPGPLLQRMAELKVPAISIAWFENGKIVWTRAYGSAGEQKSKSVTADTVFQAASLSKAVAAAGALRMVDQRQLDLDADIAPRVQLWAVPAGPPISLRQLLGHSAGLSVSGYPGYAATEPAPTPLQSLNGQPPSKTPAIRRFAAPGEKYAYSGGGFTVAQQLMEEAAQRPFPALMTQLLLKPAKMRQSSFEQAFEPRRRPSAASGHKADGTPIVGGHHVYPEYAAAGLWTTPSDYARFVIAIQNSLTGARGALLSRASARAMTSAGLGGYGLGVRALPRRGRPAIAHSGGNEGFRSYFLAFLDGRREGVVVMTNGDNGGALIGDVLSTLGARHEWGAPPASEPSRAPE